MKKFLGSGLFSMALLSMASTDAFGQPSTPPAYCAHIPAPSLTLPGATSFTYRTIGERNLRIHVFEPANPSRRRPAAIFFFGGGFRFGDVSTFADLAKAFTAQGYVAILADYRIICRDNIGAVGGIDDAEAAISWVRKHFRELRIDRTRVSLVGGSAGGALAASAALRVPPAERPNALVLFNPVLDLESGIWAKDQTTADALAYSPSRLPIDNLPPTIIFHGVADRTVPIKTSRDFCTRAISSRRRCELMEYPGQDHSFADKHSVDASLGTSPFEDTFTKALAFLNSVKH